MYACLVFLRTSWKIISNCSRTSWATFKIIVGVFCGRMLFPNLRLCMECVHETLWLVQIQWFHGKRCCNLRLQWWRLQATLIIALRFQSLMLVWEMRVIVQAFQSFVLCRGMLQRNSANFCHFFITSWDTNTDLLSEISVVSRNLFLVLMLIMPLATVLASWDDVG